MRRPVSFWWFLVALWVGAVAGFGRAGAAVMPVRIGLLLPAEDALAASLTRGARLAAESLRGANEGGIELLLRGRAGQWGDDGDEAGRLALDDGVQVLIAPPGAAAAHLALQVAGRTRTPVLLLSPESSLTGAGVPWALRVVPSTAQELALLIGPGVTRVLGPDDRRIREIAADVRGLGRTPPEAPTSREVTVEPVPVLVGGGVSALQERADALLRTRPDTVLLWLDPGPAAAWAVALRRAGFRGRLAGPGSLRSAAFIRAAGSAADGFQVPDWEPGAGADVRAAAIGVFVPAYRRASGEEPDATAVAAADAVGMAVALIRRAGDRPVHSVFPVGDLGGGLTGSWRFDRSGNRVGRLAVLEWMPSGWRPVVGGSATGSGGVVRGAEPE